MLTRHIVIAAASFVLALFIVLVPWVKAGTPSHVARDRPIAVTPVDLPAQGSPGAAAADLGPGRVETVPPWRLAQLPAGLGSTGAVTIETDRGCGPSVLYAPGAEMVIYFRAEQAGTATLSWHRPDDYADIWSGSMRAGEVKAYYTSVAASSPGGRRFVRVSMPGTHAQDYCGFTIRSSANILCAFLDSYEGPCASAFDYMTLFSCNDGREYLPDVQLPLAAAPGTDRSSLYMYAFWNPQGYYSAECQRYVLNGYSRGQVLGRLGDVDCNDCPSGGTGVGSLALWTDRGRFAGCDGTYRRGDSIRYYFQVGQSGSVEFNNFWSDGTVHRSSLGYASAGATYYVDSTINAPDGRQVFYLTMPSVWGLDYCSYIVTVDSTPTPTAKATATPTATPEPKCRPGARAANGEPVLTSGAAYRPLASASVAGYVFAGTTTGAQDKVIVDAQVSLVAADGSQRVVLTDDVGVYSFDQVASGEYTLMATAAGYGTFYAQVAVGGPACILRNLTMCAASGTADSDRLWVGEYYATRDPRGNPMAARCDADIDFLWLDKSPMSTLPNDNFSVAWQRQVLIPETGLYRFRVFSDDGFRLYVDEKEERSDWQARTFEERGVSVRLNAGEHRVRLEYVEWARDAMARLDWYRCGDNSGHGCLSSNIPAMYQTRYLDKPMPENCRTESNQTIARWGCLITSAAMALAAQGVDTDPAALNTWLTENKGYSGGACTANLASWDKITKYASEVSGRTVQLQWEATTDARTALRNEDQPVVLKAAVHGGSHFVLAADIANRNGKDTLGILDPQHSWKCNVVADSAPLPPRSQLSCSGTKLRHVTTQVNLQEYAGTSQALGYLKRTTNRTASLQFNAAGADVLLSDPSDRRVGRIAAESRDVNTFDNAMYFESGIAPLGESGEAPLERTLFVASGAGGEYVLEVVSAERNAVSGTRTGPTAASSTVATIGIVGLSAGYVESLATLTVTLRPGEVARYRLRYTPGDPTIQVTRVRPIFIPAIAQP